MMANRKPQSAVPHVPYEIDLLKGEGLPIRSRPGGVAFACIVIVVPLLAALGAVNFYKDCRVVIAIQKQQAHRYDAAAEALSDAVQRRAALEKEKAEATGVLSDVKAALSRRYQWSPALAAIVDNLSDTLVLTKLEARQETTRCKVPVKEDPSKKIDVTVPVRALRIGVCGQEKGGSAEAVRKLQESLRSSAALGPLLDTITVSQDTTTLEGQEAVHYELYCVFKPLVQ